MKRWNKDDVPLLNLVFFPAVQAFKKVIWCLRTVNSGVYCGLVSSSILVLSPI